MPEKLSTNIRAHSRIRPPLQRRSQAAWNRILEAGTQILVEQGRDALTIQATCRRAKVAPTALYARVDGLSGLFWAIYDRWIGQLITTYERLLEVAAQTEDSVERVRAVVRAMCENFHLHERFLHQIINITWPPPARWLPSSAAHARAGATMFR